MKKKLRLIIYPFLLLLFLIGGGGFYFLHTQTALRLAMTSLRQAASNAFGSELTADSWQGDLLHGLKVTNLSLQAEGRQWLAIRKIELKFDAFPLLLGLMHIKSMVLTSPELSLTIDDSGQIVMPRKATKKGLFQGLGWRWLGGIDHLEVSDGAVSWYGEDGKDFSSRDFTGLAMTGKAGFYAIPGSKKWSAWLSVSTGSLRMVSKNLNLAFEAKRIALHPDRLEGSGLHFSTGHSDVLVDLVLPYDPVHAMSLRWQGATLWLPEVGLDSDQQVISSGSIESLPPLPELSAVQSRTARLHSHVYRIQQELRFEGRQFRMEGRVEQPFSGRFAFQGNLQFESIDNAALAGLLKGLKMASAAENVRKIKKFSDLAGSLYLETRNEQQGRQWRGTLNLRHGMVGPVRLLQVELPFKITAGILQVNKGLIDTDYGRFSGNLSGLDSSVGPQFKAHGKIENFRPSFFPADLFSGKKLAASTDFTMDAEGDLEFKGELQPMQIDGHLLTGGHFEGSSIAGSITLRELTLDMGGGEMTLNGQIDKDALSVVFHFEQLPVQWLFKGQTGTLTGSGSIKKSVHTAYLLSLHLPEMQSSDLELVNFDAILPIIDAKESQREPFRIHAEKGVWRKISFESLRIEGSGRGNRYAIDSASILFNQESWRLAGSADFLFDGTDFSLTDFRLASEQSIIVASFNKSKEIVKAKIRVERMNIPEILQLFPLVDFTKGMCDIDLTVDGTLSQPVITFAGRAYYPKSGQDFHLDLAGEVADHLLRINAVAQVANQKVPVKLQMPMHLSFAPFLVNYDVDRLVVFSSISQGAFADFPLLAAYGCDGHFRFEMTMHEKDQQAQWLTGRLNLKEAGCRIPGTNLSIEDGELLFRGEKDRIILEQSKIMSNQGELLLQGEVTDLKNYPAVTGFLTVSSDDINLNYRGIYDMALSGKLTARINKGRRSLRGELTVLSADLKQPMHAAGFDRSDNTVIYASRSAQKGIRRTDILEDLDRMICGTSLDVRIKIPKNVMLHAGEFSLQLEGSLHAGGDGSGLELDGKLNAVEGTYTVAGREFKVEEGEVIFSREDGLDPALEGKAVCRMPDLIVTAKVKGTVEKPAILLESDPWMKEDEIKSAIIFGKPVSDLTVQEKNQFDTSVASLLGGTVLNRFNAITGTQTLLDSFSFYSDKQSGNESFAVGKYLTDDLLFSYRQGVKENNAAEVRVEYKLKGGFSLESLYSEEGQKSGFDFFWSKDF